MEEICAKMDKILLEYLSLISALQEQWKQISTNLGNKKDTDILNTQSEFICHYTLTTLEEITDDPKDNDSSSLRRRMIKDPENDIAKKQSKSRVIEDPLRWFGILVPSSLRESQRHFKQ
ncbi:27_t:CDS:2, partial [Racocetra fulgida]